MSALTLFDDRRSAGRLLAARLAHLRDSRPIVLAVPRSGVPVAYEIAVALDAPLDLLMVRKIGARGHPEYAIGAVIDGDEPQLVLDEEAMRIAVPGSDHIQKEASRQLFELERRRRAYRGVIRNPALTGRFVLIVDDGIATGATVTAAIRATRRHRPAQIVLAAPVAPLDTIQKLHPLCDEMVFLATPQHFLAVGEYYRDFGEVEDREVVLLLEAAAHR